MHTVVFSDFSNSILCIVYSNLSSWRFAAFIFHSKLSIDTVPLLVLTLEINRGFLPFPTLLCVWGHRHEVRSFVTLCAGSVIIHNDYLMTGAYCPQSLSMLEKTLFASLRWLSGVLVAAFPDPRWSASLNQL